MNKIAQLGIRVSLAITGQAMLLVSAWLFPFVLGYDLQSDYISEQALGRYGFLQSIAFSVGGVGIIAIASAPQRTSVAPGALMKVGGALVAIWGLAVCWPRSGPPIASTRRTTLPGFPRPEPFTRPSRALRSSVRLEVSS